MVAEFESDLIRLRTREGMKVANVSQDLIGLRRPDRLPSLTGLVADPDTTEIVSGHVGASRLMGGAFIVEPGERLDLPLTIHTDSVVAGLGYAVPAGGWCAQIAIVVPDRRNRCPQGEPAPGIRWRRPPHICLGAHLARMETVAVLDQLVRRMPDLRRAAPIGRLSSNFVAGPRHFPVASTLGPRFG